MEDQSIVDLYWARQEQAITETDRKYGVYCRSIAVNILKSQEDAEECVNDTWLRAWNAMPPNVPLFWRHFWGGLREISLWTGIRPPGRRSGAAVGRWYRWKS